MNRTVIRSSVIMLAAAALMLVLFANTMESASAATKTLTEGKSAKVSFRKTGAERVIYYKIRPKRTGVIMFSVSSGYTGAACLCNSRKKAVSKWGLDDSWIWGGSEESYFRHMYFGVKKGVTYYIKMKGSSYTKSKKGNYYGYAKWTSATINVARHGSKKSTAKAIGRKKTAKGLFVAGSTKAHWYKIKNKQKTTKIIFKAPKTNGRLKVKVYYKSYGHWYKMTYYASRNGSYANIKAYISKKVKHTYYLKVTPDGKSSGAYFLKWK